MLHESLGRRAQRRLRVEALLARGTDQIEEQLAEELGVVHVHRQLDARRDQANARRALVEALGREQGGKVMNLIIRTMSGLKFADTQCGFKAFNMTKFRPLLDAMTIDRFGFDVEFLFVANYHNLRLAEIPVRWNNVEGSKVSVVRDTRRMFNELSQIRHNARRGKYDIS